MTIRSIRTKRDARKWHGRSKDMGKKIPNEEAMADEQAPQEHPTCVGDRLISTIGGETGITKGEKTLVFSKGGEH